MNRDLKRLVADLAPYTRTIIVVAITGIIMALAQGRIAMEVKTMFDGLESKDLKIIQTTPLFIIMLAVLSAICRYIHLYLMDCTADNLTVDLRRRLQSKFMQLSARFHSEFETGTGGLISRILDDIRQIQSGLRLVADIFREPILFMFLIGWLIFLNWQLTLMLLLIVPPLVLFLGKIAKSLRRYGHKSQSVMERLTTTIKESLEGVRTIQSFNLESEMERRFSGEADEFLAHRRVIHSRTEVSGPVTETLATLVVIAIFTYLGIRIVNGQATFGDFASYLAGLLMLQKPIKKIQESFVKVQQTLVSVARVYDLLEEDETLVQSKEPVRFPENFDSITFKDVSFAYNEQKPVLKKVNLEIQRGQVVAFVGVSGSGKSTLVNLLSRFYDPSGGDIQIGGRSLKDFDLSELRKQVAMVSQDVFLFRDSIARNIHAGDFSKSEDGIIAAAKLANAHDFISKLPEAYDTNVGDRGGNLSGGEKQRVSIARAIFKDAPILILDEATSALDSASEAAVQEGLDHLMEGRTTLVVAHRLSTISSADRIVVMKDGEIVESGTHSELIDNRGDYHRFVELQKQS